MHMHKMNYRCEDPRILRNTLISVARNENVEFLSAIAMKH
jgi:hypothetical protein